MKYFKKLADHLPVQPLLDILDAHPDWWEEMTLRQSYAGSAHHSTKSIILMGTQEKHDLNKIFDDCTTEPYPHMQECFHALLPIVHAMQHACPGVHGLGRIIIARLPRDTRVDWHVDEGKYAESTHRLHVALRTNQWCEMAVEKGIELETQHFSTGELWWFNHRESHAFSNTGTTERIHLILDVKGIV
jgi:hypothetical protein